MNSRASILGILVLAIGLVVAGLPARAAERGDATFLHALKLPARSDRILQPRSVVADLHTGETFVCDTRSQRVLIFEKRGPFEYQIPGGQDFRTPLDVAVDPDGYLYLLASHAGEPALLKLDFDGLFLERLDLIEITGLMAEPDLVSVAISIDGSRLFLLDQANLRLWIVTPDGEQIGSVKIEDFDTDEDAIEQLLGHVDVYGDTVIVAVPTRGILHLFDRDGEPLGLVGLRGTGPCQSGFPMAGALDEEGMIWLLDKQRTLITRWNPDGNRCLSEHSGIGSVPGALYQPEDMALDGRGRIFVSQGFEGRVQVFDVGVKAAGTPEPKRP